MPASPVPKTGTETAPRDGLRMCAATRCRVLSGGPVCFLRHGRGRFFRVPCIVLFRSRRNNSRADTPCAKRTKRPRRFGPGPCGEAGQPLWSSWRLGRLPRVHCRATNGRTVYGCRASCCIKAFTSFRRGYGSLPGCFGEAFLIYDTLRPRLAVNRTEQEDNHVGCE